MDPGLKYGGPERNAQHAVHERLPQMKPVGRYETGKDQGGDA